MVYRLAANAVAFVHLLFIVFVVLGGLLVLRWRRLAWVHLPAAIWGAVIELARWDCPLTGFENSLLRRAGAAGFRQGFISHHLFGLIYPGGMTRTIEIALAVLVTAINVAVYRKVFH